MADTASLVARVKTDGAEQAAKQLDGFARSAEKADKASDNLGQSAQKAQPKLKGFGTGAQQVGYQVQDLVVQLQSGTSAFVALGQQGSQLAGAFGPGGAVIGAIIALSAAAGGTLYKAFSDAGSSSEDLEAAGQRLSGTLQKTSDGTYEAADALIEFIKQGATAAQVTARIEDASRSLDAQLKETTKSIIDNGNALKNTGFLSSLAASQLSQVGRGAEGAELALSATAEKLGLNTKQFKELTAAQQAYDKSATPENLKRLADTSDRLLTATGRQNKALVEYNSNLQRLSADADDLKRKQEANAKAREDAVARDKKNNEGYVASIVARNGTEREQLQKSVDLKRQEVKDRKGLDEGQRKEALAALDTYQAQELAKIDAQEKAKADRISSASERRAEAQARRDANALAAQQKQGDAFLDLIQRSSTDRLKVIEATEKQRLEKAKELNDQGAITQQEYEQARTQIMLDADTARQEELDKREKERRSKQNSADSYIEQLRAQNEGELAEIDRQNDAKLRKLEEFHAAGRLSEEQYQQGLRDIAEATDKARLDSYSSTLGDTTSALKTALGEGNALYKTAAITQTLIETYKGATAAYASLATIPIVGPGLGAAAAAAVTAAGLANVSRIRAAREQGGYLAAGQASVVGERNRPEVIVPAGASRVRTMQQLEQMSRDSGSSAPTSVQIVNQTTGRVDSATTEMTDENRLRVIIRETVSSDLQDSNSTISKTRRGTRGQPGH